MGIKYVYDAFEDVIVKIDNGRYFMKFKGKPEFESYKEKSNVLCDILLDNNKKYVTKDEYEKF